MDGKCCCVDGLVANHHVAIFVDENEIRDGDLGEVLGEGVEPEVICEDWVTD